MGQYARHSYLHMLPVYLRCQCCSAASVFTCESHRPRARALSAPVTCIYGPRHCQWHSESVTALCPSPSQSRAELQSRSDAFISCYLQSESVTGWLLSLHLCVYSPSPSQAGLLSRCCVYSPKDSESVTARVRVRLELGCRIAADAFLRPVLHNLKSDLVILLNTKHVFFLHRLFFPIFSVTSSDPPLARYEHPRTRALCLAHVDNHPTVAFSFVVNSGHALRATAAFSTHTFDSTFVPLRPAAHARKEPSRTRALCLTR